MRASESTPLVEWGTAGRPLDGERLSGDAQLVRILPGGALAAVVDGLGHGPQAAEASRLAVATLEAGASDDVVALIRDCHERLRRSRGVALVVAWFGRGNQMSYSGVGGLEAMLLRADPRTSLRRESLLLPGGVVGYQLPGLRRSVLEVRAGDVLVLATDGVRPGFAEGLQLHEPPRDMAEGILGRHATGTDDALVLVVRYLGNGS